MNSALRLRPTMLLVLIAAAMTLFAGAGRAAAAQRPQAVHRTAVAHPRSVADRHPLAYADGTLTVARQSHRRQVRAHAASAIAAPRPVAYADGTLTATRRQHHSRTRRHRVVRRRVLA